MRELSDESLNDAYEKKKKRIKKLRETGLAGWAFSVRSCQFYFKG